MYSIKLIKESFFQNLTKTISRLDYCKEEMEFTLVTPFLELSISSCRIKMSPNDHALYGIHTNKKYQSKIGLLEPFSSKTLLSLFFSIFFFSQKRVGGRRKKSISIEISYTSYHLSTLENEMYLYTSILGFCLLTLLVRLYFFPFKFDFNS